MAEKKRVENAFVLYRRLFGYVRRYWFSLLIAIFASMIYSGIDAWFVNFLKPLLNRGLVQRNREFLAYAPYLVLGVFMMRGIASFFSNYSMALVSRNVIAALRLELFGHLQRLPARFYDKNSSGHILSVMLYSVDQVSSASADVLTTAVQSSFFIIALLFIMVETSWKLSLLYFIVIPFIVGITRFTSTRVRRLSLAIQDSIGDLTHNTEENIEGYKVVRAFGGQEHEQKKFAKAIDNNFRNEMKVVAARSWSVSSVQFVAAIGLAATLFLATRNITHSILSVGGFVTMIAAMLAILKPMKDLTTMQNKLYRGLAGAQTVFEMLDQPFEVDNGKKTLTRAAGKIDFDHVNFSYSPDKAVLKDIHFSVKPGEIVALVGRSGSGKSTLVSLLPRFYAEFTGDILLDDVSVRDYRLADLREQFALVSQNITLFNDTIAANIAYGRLGKVTEEDIIGAAKASYSMDFINQFPQGIHTLIGENGVLLSGGQRQRIAIARALLKNSPILILDEATSALDTESERYIQAALDELMRQRTTLVIAHRLSTVEHADKIVVMDGGKVVEVGAHNELLTRDGYYAKLYRMQFRDVPLYETT